MTKKPIMIRDDMPEIELTPQVQPPPQRDPARIHPPHSTKELDMSGVPKGQNTAQDREYLKRQEQLGVPLRDPPRTGKSLRFPFDPKRPTPNIPLDWKRDPNPIRPKDPWVGECPPFARCKPIPPRGEPRPFPRPIPRRPIPRLPLKPKKKPFKMGDKPRKFKMGVPRKERIRLLKEKAAAEARKRPSSVVKRRR